MELHDHVHYSFHATSIITEASQEMSYHQLIDSLLSPRQARCVLGWVDGRMSLRKLRNSNSFLTRVRCPRDKISAMFLAASFFSATLRTRTIFRVLGGTSQKPRNGKLGKVEVNP
ncbi:hypothetical protein E2C01_016582 [Portunus trituberculatus]|uniref:Uncharacterized protein n=1 Tax=Portunus trituberculatus TaxID=210409 RepID=A0A5B7DRH5_PORTR|nr:hypothetical protein [Portunus trituberculatus]